MINGTIRIGSRESVLAVIQSELIIEEIKRVCPGVSAQLVTMKTTGDMILDKSLEQIGGKGLFVKELDRALLDGRCDLTVHSLKDMPMEVPGATIERRCASSLTALAFAAALIESEHADIVMAGGVDSYSQQPILVKRPEQAYPSTLKILEVKRSPDNIGDVSMLQTAENLAEQYGISRAACDEFACRSHKLAAAAWAERLFDEQIVPITIPQKKGAAKTVVMDDCVRPDCTVESLSKLKPVVKADGVVTAGNSSPMNDGASAMLVMSAARAEKECLEPLGTVTAFACAGYHPHYMGYGPVVATQKLMAQTGLSLKDFDLIEINEAFAAQSLACLKVLGLDNEADMARINVNGGAISIGHPNAASGGILVARILHEMKRRNVKRGLVTFCIGGGQGMSLVVER